MDPREKVLITGSSGLIGAALIRRLAPRFDLIALDREGPPYPPPAADCHPIDLVSEVSIEEALEAVRKAHGARLASVVHLAAYYDFSGETSPLYEDVTVRGTERLLKSLQEHFFVEQFIFSSTMLVHAPTEPGKKITEDSPFDPRWPYPESKVRTERFLKKHHGEVPLAILRIAGVYDDRCHSIPIAHQIQRIYERHLTSTVFPGDSSHGQAFVHLDDLVDAIDLSIQRRRTLPKDATMLIGEPYTPSYDELQRRIGRMIHDEEWETTEISKLVAQTGAWLQGVLPMGQDPFIKPWMISMADDHYELDIHRAESLLGWTPRRSLLDTLPRMIEALKADPVGWYKENGLEPPRDVEQADRPEAAAVGT